MSFSDLDKIIGEVRTNAQIGWVEEWYGGKKLKKFFYREKQKRNEQQLEESVGLSGFFKTGDIAPCL